jgi:FKBP-type peptidyl-prolyl cis-trans isomerase (trigger factor)
MFEIKKLEKSLIEIKGEIEATEFESYRDAALKKLGENFEIDGFRKGKVPTNILEQKLPEMAILEEMAQMALSKSYGKIIADNKIDAIGYPRINITKLAKGNPLGFTITVATLPEMKLPDYKALAKKVNVKEEKIEVTDAEFENIVKQARMIRAKEMAKGGEIDENNLPEIDDEYVKTLGGFENLEDFNKKVRENVLEEKKVRAKDKKRLEIIESIIAETNLEVPEVLIDSEVHKMLHKMRSDIEAMGLKYDDYLKNLNKTEEDLHKEFEKDAEKRAKLQLIVVEIAKAEKLEAPKDMVEAEIKKVTEIYKDVSPENARGYIESVLQNEEVFKFLEAQN